MWGYLVCCVYFLFFNHFFLCIVTDFSAAEKARGVKFCMRVTVGLLSGQVFSPCGESRGRRHKSSARGGSADPAGCYLWLRAGELNRRFVGLSIVCLFVFCMYGYGFLSGGKR